MIVWIYGGAFNEGMNWGPLNLYDGSELAARGQVCVAATNYRLGALGFLFGWKYSLNAHFWQRRVRGCTE